MNSWERSRFNLWDGPAPQTLYITCRVHTSNGAKLQAQTIAALGRIFQRHPDLSTVCRQRQLYSVEKPVIGMRALWDEDQVMTVGLHTKGRTWPDVLRALNQRVKRARAREYREVPFLGELKQLLPPTSCVAVVSFNGHFGGDAGTGPLSEVEGTPLLVTIGTPYTDSDGVLAVSVCLLLDHRVGDGKHIGLLAKELQKELDRTE